MIIPGIPNKTPEKKLNLQLLLLSEISLTVQNSNNNNKKGYKKQKCQQCKKETWTISCCRFLILLRSFFSLLSCSFMY